MSLLNYETYKSNPLNSSGFDKVQCYKGIGKDHIKKITKQNVPTPHVTGKSIPGELGKHIRMKFQERGR
ncbi:hypothetical protein SAMN04487969_1682 [Paenibacillus algorifonticola]|uniref:Uncharacterized protein n=1 Tax=Paenibacillus algorifonticola TaxID=684063 RepID=A0A1I2J972_9BACL|nr:hypothetical protein SAMN04487969_1682 [Paenibacillus algorifonticola]